MDEFSNVLPAGMHISARLMAALSIPDVGTISVGRDGSWIIEDAEGTVLDEGGDNRVPYATGYGDLVENVLTFLTFYGSEGPIDADESIFSPEAIAWAEANLMALEEAKLDFDTEM